VSEEKLRYPGTHLLPEAISVLSSVISIVYLMIAVILIVLVVFSFYGVFLQLLTLVQGANLMEGILAVLHTLLLSIIILELLETVTIYFQTHQVQVRPILFAGLTAMIRRVLVFGVEEVDVLDLLATVAVIAVLTAAIVLIGRERE
jgi:uncharacterized membrane protein (DUF373 family)